MFVMNSQTKEKKNTSYGGGGAADGPLKLIYGAISVLGSLVFTHIQPEIPELKGRNTMK